MANAWKLTVEEIAHRSPAVPILVTIPAPLHRPMLFLSSRKRTWPMQIVNADTHQEHPRSGDEHREPSSVIAFWLPERSAGQSLEFNLIDEQRQRAAVSPIEWSASATGLQATIDQEKHVEILAPAQGRMLITTWHHGQRQANAHFRAFAPQSNPAHPIIKRRIGETAVDTGPVFGTLTAVYQYAVDKQVLIDEVQAIRVWRSQQSFETIVDLSITLQANTRAFEFAAERSDTLHPAMVIELTRTADGCWWNPFGRKQIVPTKSLTGYNIWQRQDRCLIVASQNSHELADAWCTIQADSTMQLSPYLGPEGKSCWQLPLGSRYFFQTRLWWLDRELNAEVHELARQTLAPPRVHIEAVTS